MTLVLKAIPRLPGAVLGTSPIVVTAAGVNYTVSLNLTALRTALGLYFSTLSTDNAIVRFDGVAGNTQNTGVTIDDSDQINGVSEWVSKPVTALPSDAGGSTKSVNLHRVTSDNLDAGAGFIIGHQRRYVFGGSSVKGGRIAGYDFVANTAASNAASTNRNYVATVGVAYTAVGDGGTNTGAGALGGYFGSNPSAHLDTGATNVLEACGVECDITISTGASARYVRGISIVGFNVVRGVDIDCGISISGGTGHIGFKTGILFTDANRGTTENPFYASSVLMGTYWQGSTPTVDKGIDLAGFTFTTSAYASTGFSVNGSGAISSVSSIKSTGPTAGVGYATGAGGTVTQATDKTTGVTLNKVCGAITMNNAALASSATVSFVLTNAAIAATDVIVTNIISGASTSSYLIYARAAAGSATFDVFNRSGGSLSEAIVIQFVVIKGVNA